MVTCDVVQWRRVRRKVLLEGKTLEQVAMQESLTVEATADILTQRPKYKREDNPRLALFSSLIPTERLAADDRELLQWSQWIYALEQDELAFPPFGDELSRHGAADLPPEPVQVDLRNPLLKEITPGSAAAPGRRRW